MEVYEVTLSDGRVLQGPVRANITLAADTLTSNTRFDNQADALQFGSSEHAVLKRVTGK